MSATLTSSRSWSRWLTSREKWWISAIVLGGGVALVGLGGFLSAATQTVAAVSLLLVLIIGVRRGWIKLFGPVLLYDLVRTARHSRSFLLRCAYVVALLSVLLLIYNEWFGVGEGNFWASMWAEHRVPPGEMAHFADAFFTRFLAAQLGMVFLLTPAYTATALAQEKERKTLDYLLSTDLSSSEIVLGKLASRLSHLVFFLLAGLPFLGFLQLLGGVDPNLVVAGFAGTALTMLSLASLGILVSAYADRPRAAIFATYGLAGLFLMCSLPVPGLSISNPFAAWNELMNAAETGTLATTMPKVLRVYAVVHGLIAVVCCLWASARLRWWSQLHWAREPEIEVIWVPVGDGTTLVWRQMPAQIPARPPMSDHPLLWKEKYVESIFYRRGWVLPFVAFLIVLGWGIAGLLYLIMIVIFIAYTTNWTNAEDISNLFVRGIGTAVACILWVCVALRSAAGISRERERHTWDSLITTALGAREILWAKAWGSMLSVRWGWWFLGALWGMGMVTSGLHPLMPPVLAVAWLAHAALLAGMGMWFSVVSRTTLRATVYTLVAVALLSVGPSLMSSLSGPLWLSIGLDHTPSQFEDFCTYGISPPVNLWTLAMKKGFADPSPERIGQSFLAALCGVGFAAAIAVLVWRLVWLRFTRSVKQGEWGA